MSQSQLRNDHEIFELEPSGYDELAERSQIVLIRSTDFLDQSV